MKTHKKMIIPLAKLAIASTLIVSTTQLSGCFVMAAGAIATVATSANDRRDLGTQVNDQTIELRLKGRLNRNPVTKDSHIKVVSHNYHVLIAGEATNQAAINAAEAMAKEEPGVKKVWNQLRVLPNTGALTRSNDILTTGRVKTGMTQIKIMQFDPTRVNVTTVNSIVYLMGQVTEQEAVATKNFARTVSGVAGVVALFEIYPNGTTFRQ